MSSADFERGYEFFRQWPRGSLLLWARDTETGRESMTVIGRKLAAQAYAPNEFWCQCSNNREFFL